jgi:hypothetical protein
MMKIASVIVSRHGFRRKSANRLRLTLAEDIAASAKHLNASLVILPAGFLCASSVASAKKAASKLAAIFGKHGVAAIGGVDAEHRTRGAKKKRAKRGQRAWPFFVFGVDGSKLSHWQRQLSTTTANAADVPAVMMKQSSLATIAGVSVGILACGELFNEALRDKVAGSQPKIIVNVVHASMTRGPRVRHPELAKEGRAWVLSAQHVSERNSQPRMWCHSPAGQDRSTNTADDWVGTRRADGPRAVGLWAGLKTWTISG